MLTNANPAGSLDGQIRLSGASNGTKAFTLGRGRNHFVKNAGRDVSVSNANTGTAAIRVDAAGNYWGGGAADGSISGNVMLTPPTHLTSDPADPAR